VKPLSFFEVEQGELLVVDGERYLRGEKVDFSQRKLLGHRIHDCSRNTKEAK
jgi:hypothetical protein